MGSIVVAYTKIHVYTQGQANADSSILLGNFHGGPRVTSEYRGNHSVRK